MSRLQVQDQSLELKETGEGDPIVFVHGSASDLRTWDSQLDSFGERFRAIAYSRRYHWLNRPIPTGADYSWEAQ